MVGRRTQIKFVDIEKAGETLAQMVAMSPLTFARKFAQEIGATPARYVERIRIEAARRFLEESQLPVKKIAFRTGFSSEDVLRRPFLKLVGVTPSEYRKRFGFKE